MLFFFSVCLWKRAQYIEVEPLKWRSSIISVFLKRLLVFGPYRARQESQDLHDFYTPAYAFIL